MDFSVEAELWVFFISWHYNYEEIYEKAARVIAVDNIVEKENAKSIQYMHSTLHHPPATLAKENILEVTNCNILYLNRYSLLK